MPEIFICYRRSDTLAYTGRLSDYLRNCFGEEAIFRDYEALDTGVRFKQEIQDAILSSSIILVIIGPGWLVVDETTGKRRIDDKEDFVQFEIGYALNHDIPIIPLLVGGAQMPTGNTLPKKIKKLAEFNARPLTETHWDADLALLIKTLEASTGLEAPIKPTEPHQAIIWSTLLQPILYVIPDFLTLLCHPKQFLRKRCFGRPKDLINALVFFFLIALLSGIYLSNTWLPEHHSFWGSVFIGIPFWLLITLLVSVPIWMSWWVVGARGHYQRTLVLLFYQMAVIIMITHIAAIITVTGFLFRAPDLLQAGFEILKATDVPNKSERVSILFNEAMVGSPAYIASGLGIGVFCILPIWLICSWGGYRAALNRPRWASWLAFPIFTIVLTAPLLFFAWLG